MLDFFSVSHQATAFIIIIVIAVLQISAFISTIYKINTFKRIFPSIQDAFHIKEGQIDSTLTTLVIGNFEPSKNGKVKPAVLIQK